jgi:phosphoglycolate phosphatase
VTLPVIFDLDGTLVDSVADIHAAIARLLAEEGLPPLDRATVQSFVGNGLPKLVERVMGATGLPMARHGDLTTRALQIYNAAPAALTRPYPGVPAALAALRDAGHPMGICTNKPQAPAEKVLQGLGLAPFFAAVVGGDRLPVVKPDPAPLWLCADAVGSRCILFVGDSEVDSATARAAGVPFLLFTEGYRKGPVETLPHRAAFSDFAALPALVAALT